MTLTPSSEKFLDKTTLIKNHPNIFSHYQSVAGLTGIKSDKYISKMAQLPLPFRFRHNFSTNDDGCQLCFGNKNVIHKGGEVWHHIEIVTVKINNKMEFYNMDNETI